MAGKRILETERLLLREFAESDAEPFFLLCSDPDVIRYVPDPGGPPTGVAQALEVLRTHPLADYQKYGFGRWACVHKASGAVIGFAGLKYLADRREVDIGYRFLPAFWGQGLASEAGRAVLDYGFDCLRMSEVIGFVMLDNRASVCILEKLGLVFAEMVEFQGKSFARYVIRRDQPTEAWQPPARVAGA